jgi:hypothetical protein
MRLPTALLLDRSKTSALAAAAQLPKGAVWIGLSGLLLTLSIASIAAFRAGRRAQIPYDRDAAVARLQSWLGEKETSLTDQVTRQTSLTDKVARQTSLTDQVTRQTSHHER